MEFCVGGETKEYVDYVGGKIQAFAPILTQHTCQCTQAGLCESKTI